MPTAASLSYSDTFVLDVDRWKPWSALREHDDLIFGLCQLPAGVRGLYVPDRPKSFILVNSALNRAWRNAVLAHELGHHERGGGCVLRGMPDQWRAIAVREEARVWEEAARRLVPLAEVRAMRMIAELNQLAFERWHVAEHFDVPDFVAEIGVELERRAAAA